MNKKKLLSLALVVIMIAMVSFSTLAWFTDTDSATNDFTIDGAGQNDPNKIFSIEVKENIDGEDLPADNWDFLHVLPGDRYKKEAFITNTGSYDQYIRVVVTVTDWEQIKDIVTINMDYYFDENWYIYGGQAKVENDVLADYSSTTVDANGNLVFTMFLNKKLAPGKTVDIMDYVEISAAATKEDFASDNFADGFQILFEASAVQTENILNVLDNREWYNAMKSFEKLGG